MIDLEKNPDIQSPYQYAQELHYDQGLSWSQTKYALLESGVSELQAREIIANLEEQEYDETQKYEYNQILQEAAQQAEAQRVYEEEMKDPDIAIQRAEKKIKYGFFWILGGVALTFISQGMVIWWGAVLYGIIRIISGMNDKSTINNNK